VPYFLVLAFVRSSTVALSAVRIISTISSTTMQQHELCLFLCARVRTQRTDQFGSFSEMAMNGCCQPDSRYSRCCLRQTHMPCDMAASTDPQILALSF
jgi:hypothetical protein